MQIKGGIVEGAVYLLKNNVLYRAEVKSGDGVPRPERQAFKTGGSDLSHLLKQPQPLFHIDEIEYRKEEDGGGIFIHLSGMNGVKLLHPAKGFPFPEACQANNIVKRFFVGQLRYLAKHPLAGLPLLRFKGLEKWLREIASVAEIALGPYYLENFRYQKSCREIRKFVFNFLQGFGMPKDICMSFAETICFMFEYDNAYLFRIQDLLNETSIELILKNPRKELRKLLQILKQRDPRAGMFERFNSAAFLLSLALYIPKVKRAFLKAMSELTLENIQMDDADRYAVLRWSGYDFFGQSFEQRKQTFINLHEGNVPTAVVAQS